MADLKISELGSIPAVASADVLAIVDTSLSETNKVSVEDLLRGAPSGTAAAPSIAFVDDPDTGIFNPGANQIAFATNASERIRIGANGEIGLAGANYGTSGQVLTSAGSGAAPSWQTPAAVITDKIEEGNSSVEVIDTGSNGRVVFTTEGSEVCRIDSFGRVGIGTSSPAENLDLAAGGDGNANNPTFALWRNSASPAGNDKIGTIHFDGEDSAGARVTYKSVYGKIATTTAGSTNGDLVIGSDDTDAGQQVIIDSSGNVGIGTTSPGAQLEVKNTGNLKIYADASGGYIEQDVSNLDFLHLISRGKIKYQSDPSSGTVETGHIFECDGSEKLRIDNSGKVLIGTASGDGQLEVRSSSALGIISRSTTTQATATNKAYRARNNSNTDTFSVSYTGVVAKASGSFKISHPLPSLSSTHHLVHSFVEAPDASNLYAGMVDLVDGRATVNIDTAHRMTEGTFEALNTVQSWSSSNESGYAPVKCSISGNLLTIECQDATSTDTVYYEVRGIRKDQHMLDTDWTNEDGRVITEPLKQSD